MVNYLAYRVKKLPKSLQFLMWTARVKRWSYKPAQQPTSSLGARLWCRSPDCPSSLLQWQNPHAFAALGCTGGRQGASALGGCRRPVLLWKTLHCLLHALRRQKLKVALSPLYSRWRTRSPWRYTPPRFSTSSLAWGRNPPSILPSSSSQRRCYRPTKMRSHCSSWPKWSYCFEGLVWPVTLKA